MRNLFYYKLEQAEEIKQTYHSWVGKHAHVGMGVTDTLKSIRIKPKKVKNPRASTKLFIVEFEFDSNVTFSAHEFLFYNGLMRHSINAD
jgi:hypothetical protein